MISVTKLRVIQQGVIVDYSQQSLKRNDGRKEANKHNR